MALLDILRSRVARQSTSAQVDCGALGVLTVEALSPAECGRLGNNPRALLYAACRELQQSGEFLRREGRLFRPEEITELLSDEEALQAAQAVLTISGTFPEAAPAADSSLLPEFPEDTPLEPQPLFPDRASPQAEVSAERSPDRNLPEPGEEAFPLSETRDAPPPVHPQLPTQLTRSGETERVEEEAAFLQSAAASPALDTAQIRRLVHTSLQEFRPALAEDAAQLLCRELQRAAHVR